MWLTLHILCDWYCVCVCSVASGSQRLNSEDSREKNNLISNIDVSGTGIVRHTRYV